MMRRAISRLGVDQQGGVMVESALMLTILFIFTLGSVDFLMAMYQCGAATKAVQHGARIASTSAPVDSTFLTITGMEGGIAVGTFPPATFTARACAGTNASSGTCTSPGTYSVAAMNTIVNGRKSLGTCTTSGSYCAGMRDMFYRVRPENVRVTYSYSGIGFAGRPYAQVPSIEVTLINLPFQFYFIGWLFPARNIQPVATATGEDLCSQSSSCTILNWTAAGG
jgi:Flp pilus assembly protein TadG